MPDSTPSDERLIDDWLPAYAVRDVATRVVHGEPGTVFEAAKQLELVEGARASVTALAQFYEPGCAHVRELAAHFDALLPAISEHREPARATS